jgi:hypothetical protein
MKGRITNLILEKSTHRRCIASLSVRPSHLLGTDHIPLVSPRESSPPHTHSFSEATMDSTVPRTVLESEERRRPPPRVKLPPTKHASAGGRRESAQQGGTPTSARSQSREEAAASGGFQRPSPSTDAESGRRRRAPSGKVPLPRVGGTSGEKAIVSLEEDDCSCAYGN